jgi:hypothetical protein
MNPNRDNIIRMAREAGFNSSVGKTDKDGNYRPYINAIGRDIPCEWVERFAYIVIEDFLTRSGQYLTNDASREAAIAEEREACARIAEKSPDRYHAAATIRARGQA